MTSSFNGCRLLSKNPKEAMEFLASMAAMTLRYIHIKDKGTTQASSEARDEIGQAQEISQTSTTPSVNTLETSTHALCNMVTEFIRS